MGLIEDALRDTMTALVAAPPAVEGTAGRAIGRARLVRRRRSALGAVAVMVVVVMAGLTVAAARVPRGSGSAVAAPTELVMEIMSAPLPADVLTGDRIVRATGTPIVLAGLRSPQQAWRVSGGWLVRTAEGAGAAVWFVGQTGASTMLTTGEQVVVGRTGPTGLTMVAWSQPGRVFAATFVGGQLRPSSTHGAGDLRPLAVVDGGVLLTNASGTGGRWYDMWFPDKGNYVPGPRSVDRIVGATGDGSQLLGMVGTAGDCLALILPVGLKQTASTCDVEIGAGDVLSSSPDGRWLVVLSLGAVSVYDMRTVWTRPVPTATWPVGASGVAWLGDGSFVVADGNQVVRLRLDVPYRQEVTALSPSAGGSLTVISDLRD